MPPLDKPWMLYAPMLSVNPALPSAALITSTRAPAITVWRTGSVTTPLMLYVGGGGGPVGTATVGAAEVGAEGLDDPQAGMSAAAAASVTSTMARVIGATRGVSESPQIDAESKRFHSRGRPAAILTPNSQSTL